MGALITSRESSLERTHRETLNLPAILLESAYLSGEESDVKLLTLGIAYCGVGSDPSTIFFSLTLASQPHQHSFLALDPHGFHRVAYSEWGNPRQHQVVICVHGLTCNCRDFDTMPPAANGRLTTYRLKSFPRLTEGPVDTLMAQTKPIHRRYHAEHPAAVKAIASPCIRRRTPERV
jgi:hypothetical protein